MHDMTISNCQSVFVIIMDAIMQGSTSLNRGRGEMRGIMLEVFNEQSGWFA